MLACTRRQELRTLTERIRYIIQVAILVLDGLRNKIFGLVPGTRLTVCGHQHTETSKHKDLLWTDPTKSLWNTFFKIIFIGTSGYTIYLMLNDYKPTHDPNLDTFKVQYLVAGSAVLAILFPYSYTPAEVQFSLKHA